MLGMFLAQAADSGLSAAEQSALESYAEQSAQAAQALADLEKASTAAATGAGIFAGGMWGFLASIAIVGIIVGLVFFALWIWALVDVLTRTFPGNIKQVWTWLIVLSFVGPLVIGFIPFINFINLVLGPAGIVIVIVYLAAIRKKGTKGAPTPAAK